LDVLFYDGTTLYFESFEPDELRQKGFRRREEISVTFWRFWRDAMQGARRSQQRRSMFFLTNIRVAISSTE